MIWPAVWLLLGLSVWMALAWAFQRRVGNAGWVDVFWTFGTGAGGVLAALWPMHPAAWSGRQLLVAALAALWSLRLGTYIALRVARSTSEDVRYQRFRKEWGAGFQRRFFSFVIVQGPIAALMAVAIMVAAHRPAGFPAWSDVAGAAILVLAIAGESLADYQMRAWRASHQSGVCDTGLWSISRHPNYLFEFAGWVAYPVIALGPGLWLPGLFALPAVCLIYWLLVHVSGVPPLEQAMLTSRGDAFRAYQARVPAFFPWGRPGPLQQ